MPEPKNVGGKIGKWIKEGLDDISSLQVETYKANLTLPAQTPGEVNLKDFIGELNVKIDPGTDNQNLHVVMVTRSEIDHDTRVIYSANMTEDDEKFVKQHAEIVKAAAAARSEFVQLAVKFFKGDPL